VNAVTSGLAEAHRIRRPATLAERTLLVGFDDKVYPVGQLTAIVDSLAQEGIAATQALKGAHVSPAALRSHETRVSVNQVIRVCNNAAALSGDPHFGYHAGERVHVSTFGMYGFAILSSTDFREGVAFAQRYHHMVMPLLKLSFQERHRLASWRFRLIAHPAIDARMARLLVELHLSIAISLHRDGMGPSFLPSAIHLPFGPTRDAKVYQQMFGCPISFGRKESSLIFDASWLDRDAQLGNEIAHDETVKLCEEIMKQLHLRAGLAGKVRELLLMSRLAPTSGAAVAKHLHMTERTLRRKLHKERTSFRRLARELRMQMAVLELARLGSARGVEVLDVTMSGSTPVAEQGALTLFGGGDQRSFAAAEPIFRVIARKYFYLGPSGSGATMKLVVNSLLAIGMQAIAEAVALGEKAGLDRHRLLDVLPETTVVAPALVGKLGRALKSDYSPQFPLRLMNKDLGLILNLAAAVGAQMPATNAAFEVNAAHRPWGRSWIFPR